MYPLLAGSSRASRSGDFMHYSQGQADILSLLQRSPITNSDVRKDVTELVYVGEMGLAFDTLCSWIYQEELRISRELYKDLVALSIRLEEHNAVQGLDELIAE
ncbi:MafI family immunity protein [Spirillospora sp. NPDC048819]|uniref:MafI family immunity protein n=1 Tax=Spirillospora sp. NPDC048819 TaxID=3155268 RepID=UPI0033DD1C0F